MLLGQGWAGDRGWVSRAAPVLREVGSGCRVSSAAAPRQESPATSASPSMPPALDPFWGQATSLAVNSSSAQTGQTSFLLATKTI